MSIAGHAKWPLPHAWRKFAWRSERQPERLEARILLGGECRYPESYSRVVELGERVSFPPIMRLLGAGCGRLTRGRGRCSEAIEQQIGLQLLST
jgi:hypothetical protein